LAVIIVPTNLLSSLAAAFVEKMPAPQAGALRESTAALWRLAPYGLAFIFPLLTLTFLSTGPHRGSQALLWLLALPLLVFLDGFMG